jgi:hypothetical protein
MDRGVGIGVYDSRGVVTRDIGAGGVQERQLAQRYRQYASTLADAWPRTARVLKHIAEDYEADARSEDVRAELDEERWP